MRLACVYVPQLALQAALRRSPDASDAPAALLGSAGALRVDEAGLCLAESIAGGFGNLPGSHVQRFRWPGNLAIGGVVPNNDEADASSVVLL